MSIRPEADEMIEFLNSLFILDPSFVSNLIVRHIPCNNAIAEHPSVQVGWTKDGQSITSILGVLNGFIGVVDQGPKAGWGAISAVYQNGQLSGFVRTEGLGMQFASGAR